MRGDLAKPTHPYLQPLIHFDQFTCWRSQAIVSCGQWVVRPAGLRCYKYFPFSLPFLFLYININFDSLKHTKLLSVLCIGLSELVGRAEAGSKLQ